VSANDVKNSGFLLLFPVFFLKLTSWILHLDDRFHPPFPFQPAWKYAMRYLLFLITYAVAFVLVGAGLYNAHFAGPFLRSHGTYEWLADAWLERLYRISQILLVIVAGVAAVMAFSQVKSQKLIATLERNAQHNWEIFADDDCKKAGEIMLDLNVPNDDKRLGPPMTSADESCGSDLRSHSNLSARRAARSCRRLRGRTRRAVGWWLAILAATRLSAKSISWVHLPPRQLLSPKALCLFSEAHELTIETQADDASTLRQSFKHCRPGSANCENIVDDW
jgi:hypothetical protein